MTQSGSDLSKLLKEREIRREISSNSSLKLHFPENMLLRG